MGDTGNGEVRGDSGWVDDVPLAKLGNTGREAGLEEVDGLSF